MLGTELSATPATTTQCIDLQWIDVADTIKLSATSATSQTQSPFYSNYPEKSPEFRALLRMVTI